MAYKKKALEYEVEILKVKLDQMEKRLDMMDKALTFMERTHNAEMTTLMSHHTNKKQHGGRDTSSSDTSQSDTDTDTDDEASVSEVEPIVYAQKKSLSSMMRRIG
jgi:hypothetical protein